jgi:hypothetical protein
MRAFDHAMFPHSAHASPATRSSTNVYHPSRVNVIRLVDELIRGHCAFTCQSREQWAEESTLSPFDFQRLEGTMGPSPVGVSALDGEHAVPVPGYLVLDFLTIRAAMAEHRRRLDSALGENANFVLTGTRADLPWIVYFAQGAGVSIASAYFVVLWVEWIRLAQPMWSRSSAAESVGAVDAEIAATHDDEGMPTGADYLEFRTGDDWAMASVHPYLTHGDAFARSLAATHHRQGIVEITTEPLFPACLAGETLPRDMTVFPFSPDIVSALLRCAQRVCIYLCCTDAPSCVCVCAQERGSRVGRRTASTFHDGPRWRR